MPVYPGAPLASARAILDLMIFGHEGVSDAQLQSSGIDLDRWKRLAVDCLLQANKAASTGNLHELQSQIGILLAGC